VGTRVDGWIWTGRTDDTCSYRVHMQSLKKNGHVHEGRIDKLKLPHTTAAAHGTCEHQLNLTALQTSEVDPHQQNGGCVRFGNLSHNKLVNEHLRIIGVTTNWWTRELRIPGSKQTSETGDIRTTKWRMCKHRKLEATNKLGLKCVVINLRQTVTKSYLWTPDNYLY